MSEQMLTVDLHCHPNLKSFNSGFPEPEANMWDVIHHKTKGRYVETINDISKHVLKQSQCNLDAMAAGNVRVFQLSLYPTERGFLHMRNVPNLLIGKRSLNTMHSVITGYAEESIVEMKKHYHYYEELVKEYEYVSGQQGKSPDGKSEFVLVNNYKELQAALKNKNTLIGIVTIEGAHAFGTGTPDTENRSIEELKKMLTERIATVKQWENPPFIINLAHHFNNDLCGHATSFKRPINSLINQNKNKDKGINELGWHVLRELLGRHNGKRILIDTKHMSVASRKEYYAFLENYNFLNPDDRIPIITSHAGMNGFSTLDSSIKDNDIVLKTRHHRLYRWSINISNEEARLIHASGGLIGLMMDRGMLGGLEVVQKIAELTDPEKQRKEYARLFLDNAFAAVKAIGEKSGWDVVAFGSDYDGTITHMDPYDTAAKLPMFQQDLIAYLEENQYQKEHWYGYTPTQIVSKMMHENAMLFFERFFV